MIKKGSLLLIALLLSLPSCMEKKEKKAKPKKNQEVAQIAPDKVPSELELADADIDKLFNELGEFDTADAGVTKEGQKEEFAWTEDTDEAKLDAVHFAFDSSRVIPAEEQKLMVAADKAKQLLAEAQADGFDAKLVVEGYACKSAGTERYNKKLSEKRAQHVAQRLVESGIRKEDVEARGLGNTNLIVEKGSREEQAPNRRVEFHVVYS